MSAPSAPRNQRTPIMVVIGLAGFAFLISEVCWNRLLSLALGATVTASTIVLSAFMAGFGGGALLWGRLARSRRGAATLLAALLAGAGVLSYLVHQLLPDVVRSLNASIAGEGPVTGGNEPVVYLVTGLMLFAPSFLMGGTFPLISRMAVGGNAAVGATLGRLYAVETLGSTVGGLVAGFVLLGLIGQHGTMVVAVVVEILLAAWLLWRRPDAADAAEDTTDARPALKSGVSAGRSLRGAAFAGTFACGFTVLGLQVLWLRMFRVDFINTSYSFALVASTAVLGLFLGSALYARRSARIQDPAATLGRTLAWLGLAAGLGLALLVRLPQVLMFPFQGLLVDPLARTLLLPWVASLLIVAPPAAISGFAFPLACSMATGDPRRVGRDVGLVLSFNTLGSVLGPLAATFLLLPKLGAVVASLAVLLVLGVTTLGIMPGSLRNLKVVVSVVVLGLLATVVSRPEIRVLPPSFLRFDHDVLFYRETVEGTLSVGEDRRSGLKQTFVNNSAVIGSTYDAVKVVRMVGHFPFFMGLEAEDVLVVGFGIGVTTSAIASHPEVKSIECVELVTGLKDAAHYYADLNRGVDQDPRLHMIEGDGRHYLQRTTKTYDLISCDPTHPILGSGGLYTREYFQQCREHLNPGGMLSQYLPLHKLGQRELLGIIATFHEVFPHGTVWLGHFHGMLLGSTEPQSVDFADWSARVAATAADEPEALGMRRLAESRGMDTGVMMDPYHLAVTFTLDPETIAEMTEGLAANTDDLSYTEFFDMDCLDARNVGWNLKTLVDRKSDLLTVFRNVPDHERLARYRLGNRILSQSLDHYLAGRRQAYLEGLRQACRVNPENREYPYLFASPR